MKWEFSTVGKNILKPWNISIYCCFRPMGIAYNHCEIQDADIQQSVSTIKLLQYLFAILGRLDKETTTSPCTIGIVSLYFQNAWSYIGPAYTLYFTINYYLYIFDLTNHMYMHQCHKNVCTGAYKRQVMWNPLKMSIGVSGKRDIQFPHLLKVNVIWQDQQLICRLYIIAYCSKGNTLLL